jgi:hypothetical protein
MDIISIAVFAVVLAVVLFDAAKTAIKKHFGGTNKDR